jgi:hypothetical protein
MPPASAHSSRQSTAQPKHAAKTGADMLRTGNPTTVLANAEELGFDSSDRFSILYMVLTGVFRFPFPK